jgi:hypothetical protein
MQRILTRAPRTSSLIVEKGIGGKGYGASTLLTTAVGVVDAFVDFTAVVRGFVGIVATVPVAFSHGDELAVIVDVAFTRGGVDDEVVAPGSPGVGGLSTTSSFDGKCM